MLKQGCKSGTKKKKGHREQGRQRKLTIWHWKGTLAGQKDHKQSSKLCHSWNDSFQNWRSDLTTRDKPLRTKDSVKTNVKCGKEK